MIFKLLAVFFIVMILIYLLDLEEKQEEKIKNRKNPKCKECENPFKVAITGYPYCVGECSGCRRNVIIPITKFESIEVGKENDR